MLSRRSSDASSTGDTSFFELIDIRGKDDVTNDLETRVEQMVNTAIGFLINMKEYNVKQKMKENPHLKVNLETYMYKVLTEQQIKYLLDNGITYKPPVEEKKEYDLRRSNQKPIVEEKQYEDEIQDT